MQLANYVEKAKHRIADFLQRDIALTTTQRCCVTISAQNISILHVDKTPESMRVLLSKTLSYSDIINATSNLANIVKDHQLANIPVYWLLAPQDYQLFLLDYLPVKENELRDALSWRIKSLINFPIQDAVMDYFSLPEKKSMPSQPMIAAVVTKNQFLTDMTNMLKHAGLKVVVIDIPELAMRNLTALSEDDEKSTGFIYFYKNAAIFNITCKKILYFSRHIKLSASLTTSTDYSEQFSLDITRYFDYFQHQWRYARPARVFIGSERDDLTDLIKVLSHYLLLAIQPFSVNFITPSDAVIENKQLLMLGSLLRKEKDDVAAGN
ncbi:MAG: hypothetical protein A3E83_00530 [Gammaproteobacteria bacterium RIFCSPHIGHO2_12_FULL_41_20]|nr:MAG: hypothetical protein A3E83_00530 [Gammaproteobacteria bacterium RIFCSPHIGHO2_12_FULL_41_20]